MPNRVLRDWTGSERINSLGVHEERFFARLIMKADDYGCFYADARLLKANLFPLLLDEVREADISRWIASCEKAGLIVLYEVNQKQYLQIIDFRQRLRTMSSKFPRPPGEGAATSPRPEHPDSPPDGQMTVIRQSIDGHMSDSCPPELETKQEEKPKQETRREGLSLAAFEKMFDDLWLEQMRVIHKGKDIPQAIREAYAHLEAGGRLLTGELADFKRTVNSFLSNKRTPAGGPLKPMTDRERARAANLNPQTT